MMNILAAKGLTLEDFTFPLFSKIEIVVRDYRSGDVRSHVVVLRKIITDRRHCLFPPRISFIEIISGRRLKNLAHLRIIDMSSPR